MFKLKHLKQIGGSLGGGSSSGTNAARGTRTGTASESTNSNQKTSQFGTNQSRGKTSQQSKGTTGTQGSKKGTSATQQTSRTKGTTGTKGGQQSAGKGTSTQSQRQKGTSTASTTGTTTGTSGTTGTAQSNLQQTLASLDEGTQSKLTELLSAIGSPEQAEALQQTLTERALSAETDLNAGAGAIVDSARRSGERDIVASTTRLGKSAGSTQNSLVEQIGLEAQVDLETELAALKASLGFQIRDTATSELQGALNGSVGGAVNIADILKGSTQTTTQTSAQTTGQQQTTSQQNNQVNNQSTVNIGDTTAATTSQQNATNQSTQVIDQSNVSNANTQTAEQTQQLVTALQSILGTSSSIDISALLNQVSSQTEKQRKIDEAFQSSGNTQGQQIGGAVSGGYG